MIKEVFDSSEVSKYEFPEEVAFAFFRNHSDIRYAVVVHNTTRDKNFVAYGYDFIDNAFFNEGIKIVEQADFYKRKVSCFKLIKKVEGFAEIRNMTKQYLQDIEDAKRIKDLF